MTGGPPAGHPAARWAELAATEPSRPFVTCYDDTLGERIELSVATADNWVAKTANLLVDDLGCEPGDRLALLLPAHWRTACLALAAWSAGMVVVPAAAIGTGAAAGGDAGAAVAVTDDPDRDATLLRSTGAATVLRVALPALARTAGFSPPSTGTIRVDYNAEIIGHGDRFAAVAPWQPTMETAPGWSAAALIGRAAEVVANHGLDGGSRLLSARAAATTDDLLWWLVVPLVAGCGVVVSVGDPTPAVLADRARQERVTATVGCDLAGLARLDRPAGHG